MKYRLLVGVVGLVSLPSCCGLVATANSTCASICMDNPALNSDSQSSFSTNATNLTCNDSAYNKTAAGEKFENCVTCLQTSTSSNDEITDQVAFLYNLRATLSACLFSFPNAAPTTTNSACNIPFGCGPLKSSIETGILNATNGTGFEYCSANFNQDSVIACVQCFQASDDQKYLANFLIALEAGCQQKPVGGKILALSGTVFNDDQITIGAPATVIPQTSNKTGLPIGAIIGIVFVCVLLLMIVATVFLIRRRRNVRRRTQGSKIKELNLNFDDRYGAVGMRSLPSQLGPKVGKKIGLTIKTTGI